MLKAVAMGPKVPYNYFLVLYTGIFVVRQVPRARGTLSKRTTIDCNRQVSKKSELGDIAGLTLDSGKSAPLLLQYPPPLSLRPRFYSVSH